MITTWHCWNARSADLSCARTSSVEAAEGTSEYSQGGSAGIAGGMAGYGVGRSEKFLGFELL